MTGLIPDQYLDPVARLHVLAAALPGAVIVQRRVQAPLAVVWRVVADLEGMLPRYEPGLIAVRIVQRRGVRLQLRVTFDNGVEEVMDARLRSGWCLMQSPTAIAAFAARPVGGGGTLLAHLEHRRWPAPSARRPHRAARAKLEHELLEIERLATEVFDVD